MRSAVSRFLVPALAMLLAVLPAHAKVFDPAAFTLANGMQVVVITNMRAPVVTHMVWYKVGSADEPRGKSGIAHYLEHLMFKGTDKLAAGEISKVVARLGGRDNAFTAQDYTGYFQTIAVEHLPRVMEMEADRMVNLRLTDEVSRPELAVVLEERRSRIENEPASRLYEQAQATLWVHHPYGTPVIGWEHEIRELGFQDALDFYRSWYAPNNAILIVAGAVTEADVRPLAEKFYGSIASRPVPARNRVQEPARVAGALLEMTSNRVQQPSWSRRWLAPSYGTAKGGTDPYALQVLAEIIGGGATSRLNRSLVVEQQVAASAGADYDPSRLDLASFVVYASPRPGGSIDEVEKAVEAELKRLRDDGLNATEVARAVKRLQAGAVFARDSLSGGARTIGVALTTGSSVADVEAWPERIGKVTAEQVTAAARAVLRDGLAVTSVLKPEPRP